MSKQDKLATLILQADEKYGKGTIIKGANYPELSRISTGVFSLDTAIGGGVPKGRIMILTGNEATGKSSIAQSTIAQFQQTCRNCLKPLSEGPGVSSESLCCCNEPEPHKAIFIDIEGTFDPVWFKCLGGDVDALYLSQPQFSEQAVDIVEAIIRTNEIDIIVVDSIAMMSPAEEIEKSAEDLIVGTHAKLTNRMMRTIQASFNSLGMDNLKKPAVILINQLRDKVGVMFGSPTVMPGGKGQLFASSVTVSFAARPSEKIFETTGKKKDQKPVGQLIRFTVTKNKTFPPFKSGMFVLYTDDSEEYGVCKGWIDNEIQMVQYGVRYEVIEKKGSWFEYGGTKIQGEAAMGKYVLESPEVWAQLRTEILERIRISAGSREE